MGDIDVKVMLQLCLVISLILAIQYGFYLIKAKWYMMRNPPRDYEMQGTHITDEYFIRIKRELNEK